MSLHAEQLTAAIQGFAVSFGLIVAIGPQNAFVLRQGLRREHVGSVTGVCFLSDSLLIAIGVAGAGTLFAMHPVLRAVMVWAGIAFIFTYGALAFRAATRPRALATEQGGPDTGRSRRAAVATALAFTWLNPHAYVDTLVLIGGVSAQYTEMEGRLAFGIGAICGSALWFFGLGYGAAVLAPLFRRPTAWRVLDIVVGLVMWTIAGVLAAGQLG